MGNDNWVYKMDTDEATESTYLLKERDSYGQRESKGASKGRKMVVLFACIMQQFVSIGIGYGLSVMYAELVIVFDAKRSEVALIQSLYMGIAVAAGICFTGIIRKCGPGNSMMVGAVIGCIGLFLSSLGGGLTEIIICTGIVSSIGMCVCYLAAFISVSWMFHDDPAFFLVCLSLGVSLGQFVLPFLFELFISQYSWTGAFILMAGIALQNLPFGLLVQCSKRYYVTGERDRLPDNRNHSICDVTLFKDIVLWIIWINFHLVSLTGNLEAWFLVDLAVLRGFTRESGSTLVSTMGFANTVGRILGAAIRFHCTRFPTVYHWIYLPVLLAVGHVLIVNLFDYWGLFGVCVMYGMTFGVAASQIAAIMFEASGLQRYPQAMAVANFVLGIANFIGGFLGGYIMDTIGSYDLVFYISVGLSIYASLSTVVVIYLMRKREKQRYTSDYSSMTTSYKFEQLESHKDCHQEGKTSNELLSDSMSQ